MLRHISEAQCYVLWRVWFICEDIEDLTHRFVLPSCKWISILQTPIWLMYIFKVIHSLRISKLDRIMAWRKFILCVCISNIILSRHKIRISFHHHTQQGRNKQVFLRPIRNLNPHMITKLIVYIRESETWHSFKEYQRCTLLTHWSLGDVEVILPVYSPNSFHKYISWALIVKHIEVTCKFHD